MADAAVVGVDDDEWGQRLIAVVVRREGCTVDSDELKEYVRTGLRGSRTPDQVVFRPELPHTPTGKLLRSEIVRETSPPSSPDRAGSRYHGRQTRAGSGTLAVGDIPLVVKRPPHVRVNTLTLGMVRTEQAHLHYGDEEGIAAVECTIPLGRMAAPSEVGDTCVFLASDTAAYITGSNLVMHGGGERPAFLDAATANKEEAQ